MEIHGGIYGAHNRKRKCARLVIPVISLHSNSRQTETRRTSKRSAKFESKGEPLMEISSKDESLHLCASGILVDIEPHKLMVRLHALAFNTWGIGTQYHQ